MITYDGTKFKIVSASRSFESSTTEMARRYAQFLAHITNLFSPQDMQASTSTAAMDLCHHVSFGDIELMVVCYLNGDININQFMILVGSVMRPSWSNITFPPSLIMMCIQWATTVGRRIQIFAAQFRGQPHEAAQAANWLVATLNNAIPNLRYGHRSTNRSIQGHFDLRLQRGLTFDPIMLATILYGHAVGRPVFAAESSALISDWDSHARRGEPILPTGEIKMSESDTQITTTRSGNPVMGSPLLPVHDQIFRGSARIWLPVSIDSLIYIIGAVILYYVFYGYIFSSTDDQFTE